MNGVNPYKGAFLIQPPQYCNKAARDAVHQCHTYKTVAAVRYSSSYASAKDKLNNYQPTDSKNDAVLILRSFLENLPMDGR